MLRVLFLSASFLFVSFVTAAAPKPFSDVHLSPYGLAKPMFIASGPLPKDVEAPKEASIVNAKSDPAPEGFLFLKTADAAPDSGKIGLFLPNGAVLKVENRRMMNAGAGSIILKLAKSENRPARTIELSGKDSFDYNELRRCAIERAMGSPYPPVKPELPIVPKGTLVIVGGGGTTAEISKRFLQAGGGEDGHFVVLPISMPDPINVASEERYLRRLGAKNVTVIPFREKKDLEDPKTIAILKKATGLWFGGGRQWNFMDAYEGTQLPELFYDVLNRGGVIGGSSAGATIQGDYMVRGAPAGPQIMMCEGYERGLGFLPGVGIDQHFSARNRFKDLTAFVKRYPQFLGIGLDEATAIVVQGSTAEVVGKGKVHFYDANKKHAEGEKDYDAYPEGTQYDLIKRKVLEKK